MRHWIAAGMLGLSIVAPAGAADDAGEKIRAALAGVVPGSTPDSVQPSGVSGLYEVRYGAQILYVSDDGRYLFDGEFIDLQKRVNVTEQRRGEGRLNALRALGEESMIVYKPKGQVKHTITVFTDIDCGYCRKLHNGMAAMNDLGIEVRYLAYPRAGINSPSYDKAVSVWCAEDRNKAMDAAKAGEPLKSKSCDSPVTEHLALGESFGVRGTPALVLDSGELLPGYLPPDRLVAHLEGKK